MKLAGLILAAVLMLFASVEPVAAQQMTIDFGKEGSGFTERLIQIVALVTILSVAPSILIMVTSFVRIVVVLSLLRTAIGIPQSPPNSVMISLALFLTAFVMGPTLEKAYTDGIQPLMEEKIEASEAFTKTTAPLAAFMLKHVRESDLELFFNLAKQKPPATAAETPLRILVPAFMISELRRAFEIGFLLFIPFLIIDMVIASLLMAMGMMMLPPVTISLPFKLIFFVLVDGWALVAGSLVQSYGAG